jgi:hypothetical protein
LPTGYGSSYRAVVIDTVDPLGQNRLQVNVPDVGIESQWAEPCLTSHYEGVPGIGDEVSVMFEASDSDRPVWLSSAAAQGTATTGGYGVYRATVVDGTDPEQSGRVQVTVPDVSGSTPVWATPSTAVGSESPSVGGDVWVQFEGGNSEHPVWVGLR